MRNKLKKKFIVTALCAISIVLFLVLGIINGFNYFHNLQESNRILTILLDNNGNFPHQQMQPKEKKRVPGLGPETPFETRYFSVTVKSDGTVISLDTSHINAIDEEQAISYAKQVYHKESGLIDIYRYQTKTENNTATIVFIDDSRNINSFQSTLKISICTSLLGLSAVAILLYIFSSRAISPVIESYEKQKRFITDASHELKTPLTVMNADIDLLEMECEESEWIQDLRKQSENLTNMTNHLISLARMDEENTSLTFIDIPFSDIAEECCLSFQNAVQTHNLTMHCEIEPLITIRADEKMIHQLCNLLLDNAVKYAKNGTSIHVCLRKESKNVIFAISNISSLPITRQDCAHIFERFYRSEESRASSISGSGLGLSLAKHIVLLHHGKIKASIQKEQLFSIIITFPI